MWAGRCATCAMACRRVRVCQCAATLAWSAAWRSGLAPCPARWQSAPNHSLAVPSKVQWPRVPGVVAAAAREPTTEVNGGDRETHLAVRPVRGHTLDAAGAALDGFPALAALHKHEFARREEALVRVQMQVVPAVGRERHRGACAGPGDACLGRRRHDRSSRPRTATTSGESEWRRGDGRCECGSGSGSGSGSGGSSSSSSCSSSCARFRGCGASHRGGHAATPTTTATTCATSAGRVSRIATTTTTSASANASTSAAAAFAAAILCRCGRPASGHCTRSSGSHAR